MTQHLEQLMQLLQKVSEALCVSWIQLRLRLGYSKACGLCDEALNAGLFMLANRETTDGSKEFADVQPGHAPQMTLAVP